MKVYILTREPFPNGMAATNRIKCYAKAILEEGIPCEVIIFTRTEVYGKQPKNLVGEGTFEGIPYRYIGKTPLRNKNIFTRQINDFTDRIRVMHYLFKSLTKNDIVLGYCNTFVYWINIVINIIHKKQAYYIRELCELPYGTSQETAKTIKLRKLTLKKQFPKCDGFIAISDALVALAQKYKKLNASILKLPILVDYEKYYMIDKSKDAEIPYIFHSGTLYEQKDGILGMIEAFGIALSQIQHPIYFILTGEMKNSPHKKEIEILIQKYHLKDKIIFTGYLSDNDLKNYLQKSSLVIINKYNTQQNKYCFSTKLAEYLAANKAVIITEIGEAMNWLENKKNAYIVKPGDTQALADKIIEAFLDTSQREAIAKNGNLVCKNNFDYRRHSSELINFFKDISHKNK